MNANIFSPLSFLICLNSALSVIVGKKSVEESFDFSSIGFWQAVTGSWLIGMILAIVPASNIGMPFILSFGINSLVSILFYSILVWHFLLKKAKTNKFTKFLVPFFWVGNVQVVIIVLVTLFSNLIGNQSLQFFLFPIVLWFFYVLFNIAKDQTQLSGWYAVGLLVCNLMVDLIFKFFLVAGVTSIS